MSEQMIAEIEPDEFAQKYRLGELRQALLLDVREPAEWDVYHLEEAKLVPLNTLPDRITELHQEQETYVFCAHGMRSLQATGFLQKFGFKKVINVNNGLAAVMAYLESDESDDDTN